MDDDTVLIVARQYATGKVSGAETVSPVLIFWRVSGDEVVRLHWRFDREGAIQDLATAG